MNPNNVPAEILATGMRAWSENSAARPGSWSAEGHVAAILAAVLPAHERQVRADERARIVAALRDAADNDDDPDGVDPLAAAISDRCHRDDETGATWDDPRRIATVAYQWLADHIAPKETP